MRLFNSKHQKLILQCYPAGKAVDKKVNSSELSYLLYYASTRRVKLEKVVAFLERKSHSDSHHNRVGNLQVTLTILSSLIERCADNLNVFAHNVGVILDLVFGRGELALSKSALKTYEVFCSKLDGGLFSGDKQFVDSFTLLSEKIIKRSCKASETSNVNALEWKMIALMACRYVTSCLGHNSKLQRKLINLSIPLYISSINTTKHSRSDLLTRISSNVNVEGDQPRLSKVISGKTLSRLNKKIDEDFANDASTQTDVTEESFRGLNALFNTTSTIQVIEATKAVLRQDVSSESDQEWYSTFLEMCTTWIPVQLRFITLSTLLSQISKITEASSKTETNYEMQLVLAHHILGLVSSEVNMIGLSISDIIQQLLSLQFSLFIRQSNYLDANEINKLSTLFSQSICNLSVHIYYFDQVPDSIQEIFMRIDSVFEYSFEASDGVGEKIYQLICTHLNDISVIFNRLRDNSSAITRNSVSLEHWDVSLGILNPNDEFGENKQTVLSNERVENIQTKFFEVFTLFVNTELKNTEDNAEQKSVSQVESQETVKKGTLEPDYNKYITSTDNSIAHFLIHIQKCLKSLKAFDPKLISEMLNSIRALISVLGVNFVANFIPFFYHWVITPNKDANSKNEILLDSIAYAILLDSLTSLDGLYHKELKDYCISSSFYKQALSDIKYRKANDLWFENVKLTSEDRDLIDGYEKHGNDNIVFNANRDNFEKFCSKNDFISQWLDTHRPLILDIIKKKKELKSTSLTQNTVGSDSSSHSADITNTTVTNATVNSGRNDFHHASGLGLGSAVDIISIHSELMNNHTLNRNFQSNGSLFTLEGKSFSSPKVSDLKDAMSEHRQLMKKPSVKNRNTTPSSVLNKQMISNEVDSILDQLSSDDDTRIVL